MPRSATSRPPVSPWQRNLASAITDPAELLAELELPSELLPAALRAATDFPLRVPRGFVARMERGNPRDPLLLQVLPLEAELRPVAGFVADAVGEWPAMTAPGMLSKYEGRMLLVTTGACAVHCRYCFRRHFPYAQVNPMGDDGREAVAVIEGDPSLHEVILSGGDPLSLNDRRLAALVSRLEKIPHLRRLRVHTRLPVVVPERVDEGLLRWLAAGRLQRVVVIHANHPREMDAAVAAAMRRLVQAGITVLNQAVLLHGINDHPDVLVALSERLFEAGVLPYYLHLLDPVAGAAHFAVEPEQARGLLDSLRQRLPGYLVPRMVREESGAPYKRPL